MQALSTKSATPEHLRCYPRFTCRNSIASQVGENLQDHLLIPTAHASKSPMVEADRNKTGLHVATYLSCALPVADASSTTDSDSAVSGTMAPRASSSTPSAVIGVLCTEGGRLPRDLGPNICLTLTRPGLLGAVARAAVMTLSWIAGQIPPIRRTLQNTRSMVMALTTIKSKGTVRLASGTDASAPPLIDPAYLSHPEDRQAVWQMWCVVRRAQNETEAGKAVLGSEISPGKK